ncbi:MAG TPA: hypothetical protein VGN47_14450 [Blastococcus sp.]|nr:hypothetical protein [Blastococcus sp.]
MISPLVAQLIAEERIAAGSRAAENARLSRLFRAERAGSWARVTHLVGATATRLGGLLHHHRPAAAVVPCTCA